MRLQPNQRRERVLEQVRELGRATVVDLAAAFGVSAVTMRQDVEELESRGELRRTPETVLPVNAAALRSEELTLGMVLPNTEYYFSDIIDSARRTAAAHGARLVVSTTRYAPEQDAVQADKLLADGADGLILIPSWPTGEAGPGDGWILDKDVPTVLAERWVPPLHPLARLDRVSTDHGHGIGLAVQRLADQGHRRILLTVVNNLYARRLGTAYRAALEALDLAGSALPPLVTVSELPERERRDQLLESLCSAIAEHEVTAVVMHTGLDAVVTVPRLLSRGIRIPEDLAVIAYDDEVAELADVPLTSIATPKHAVGATAAELLLRRIADPAASPHHAELMPELRVRDSG
ncbi:substrate-binding domain-containing protein [Streptomyces pathocidini]|uniref:LacI family DNA-binding transcriptional regulator n=1 Tax=Streptomyces pathocidini TaxID=1650571 RepID=A0ABW7UUR4_9ACTN|nr:LacI family DNA-binding transcriptional regulator [Streptomyces pathocidini]